MDISGFSILEAVVSSFLLDEDVFLAVVNIFAQLFLKCGINIHDGTAMNAVINTLKNTASPTENFGGVYGFLVLAQFGFTTKKITKTNTNTIANSYILLL